MAGWRNPEQIELVYTAMQSPWTQPRCQLRNISADGRTLTMAPCLHALPGGRVHGTLRWFMSGLPATIENAFELLRHAGEFRARHCGNVCDLCLKGPFVSALQRCFWWEGG